MARFDHRKSRPLHQYRHGLRHYQQHVGGERHAHERRSRRRADGRPPLTPKETLRDARRWVRSPWPFEVLRQVLLGIVLAAGIVFVVCAVWGTITILQARNDLRGAQGEATAIAVDRHQLFTSAGRATAGRRIAAMERGTRSAAELVGNSVPLNVLSWIPFVGQQVDGVKSLTDDLQTTSVQADDLLQDVDVLVASSKGTSVSLSALSILQAQVAEAVHALKPLDRGSGLLIGPIASARNTFDHEIVKVTKLLATGQNLLAYAGPFLGADGPRTYLVAGENNAEMRDQGAVLSWAILSADNGTFSMQRPSSVGSLRLAHPAAVPLPPGTAAAFGLLDPTQVWQSVNATGDFALSGQIMAAMYHQRTGESVDGVIGIDVPALSNVLKATGPVDVKGIPWPVTSGDADRVLLNELYFRYPHNYEQGTRHDEIADVAVAAVHRMRHHAFDLAYLVDLLAKATKDRHLLLWSRFPSLERAIVAFGASGSLTADGPDSVHLAIESAVAAKLDYYVRTAVVYDVYLDRSGTAYIVANVTVANTAPPTGPHYVLGPDHFNSFVRGQYVARLDLWFPRGSEVPGGLDESGLVLSRAVVNLLPGTKNTYVLEAILPHALRAGRFSLSFVPQSSLWPQLTKVDLDAPSWSVTGPRSTLWTATSEKTISWQLSS